MNEPATGDIAADSDAVRHGQYSHERYRNQYALLMAMATTAGLREAMPELRTFVLSRAGFAGIQRYAANWMGDNLARWDHLWLSIAMGAGLRHLRTGLRGRRHRRLRRATPARVVPALDAVRRADPVLPQPLRDRQRRPVRLGVRRRDRRSSSGPRSSCATGCCPTCTPCFLTASETGAPVQRPMIFDHQYDGTVRDLDDQYLLGPDLLVAPVTAPGMTARQVYLPAGTGTTGTPVSCVGAAPRSSSPPTPMDHDPDLRPRRCGDPDVARGAAVDQRVPPRGDRAPSVRPDDRRHSPLDAAGGRRADLRRPVRRMLPDRLRAGAERATGRAPRRRWQATAIRSSPGSASCWCCTGPIRRWSGWTVRNWSGRRPVRVRQLRYRFHRRVHRMTIVVRTARPEEYGAVGL